MVINVGNKEYGYKKLNDQFKEQLQHYLENVAPKFEGEFVEANKSMARSLLNGTFNFDKYKPVIKVAMIATFALIGMGDIAFASAPSGIDLTPLSRLQWEIYYTLLKAVAYIVTPIFAWIGYVLLFGGASTSKRDLAKQIGKYTVLGTAFIAGAPWIGAGLMALWHRVFGV